MNPMLGGQWGSILFGGQWKVPNLVALRRFQAWWPLEWEGKASFSPPSTFHPIIFYLNIFSIDFRVLFFYGSRLLFCIFPSFSLTYKLQSHISRYKVFHTLIAKLILIKDFFSFPWIHGVVHNYVLQASSHTNEWRITPRVIPKLDTDLSPSWWKFWTMKNTPSSWSQTPSSLILSIFSKLSYLGDFVISWPHF
jgi:hypothetical protein